MELKSNIKVLIDTLREDAKKCPGVSTDDAKIIADVVLFNNKFPLYSIDNYFDFMVQDINNFAVIVNFVNAKIIEVNSIHNIESIRKELCEYYVSLVNDKMREFHSASQYEDNFSWGLISLGILIGTDIPKIIQEIYWNNAWVWKDKCWHFKAPLSEEIYKNIKIWREGTIPKNGFLLKDSTLWSI